MINIFPNFGFHIQTTGKMQNIIKLVGKVIDG